VSSLHRTTAILLASHGQDGNSMGRMTHEGTRIRARTSHTVGVTAGVCVVTHACTHVRPCMWAHVRGHEAHVPSQALTRPLGLPRAHVRACGHEALWAHVGAYTHGPRGGHTRAGPTLYHSIQRTPHRLETLSNILS
jgi:hypothetical protein